MRPLYCFYALLAVLPGAFAAPTARSSTSLRARAFSSDHPPPATYGTRAIHRRAEDTSDLQIGGRNLFDENAGPASDPGGGKKRKKNKQKKKNKGGNAEGAGGDAGGGGAGEAIGGGGHNVEIDVHDQSITIGQLKHAVGISGHKVQPLQVLPPAGAAQTNNKKARLSGKFTAVMPDAASAHALTKAPIMINQKPYHAVFGMPESLIPGGGRHPSPGTTSEPDAELPQSPAFSHHQGSQIGQDTFQHQHSHSHLHDGFSGGMGGQHHDTEGYPGGGSFSPDTGAGTHHHMAAPLHQGGFGMPNQYGGASQRKGRAGRTSGTRINFEVHLMPEETNVDALVKSSLAHIDVQPASINGHKMNGHRYRYVIDLQHDQDAQRVLKHLQLDKRHPITPKLSRKQRGPGSAQPAGQQGSPRARKSHR